MRTLTRAALTGAAAITLSLTASPALADEHCTYVDGTTRCETVTVQTSEKGNKTTTTTQYERTVEFGGVVVEQTSGERTVTQKKNGQTQVVSNETQTTDRNGVSQTCTTQSSYRTDKDGAVKKNDFDRTCS